MLYNFRLNIYVRTLVLIGLIFAFVYSFQWQPIYLITVTLGLSVLLAVASLMRYVEQTNRDVAGFLNSVQYNDFTTTSSAEHRGKTFGELYGAFNVINRKFMEIRAEREANHQFLQTVVEHVSVGLLCFNGEEVVFMNKALQQLLHKPHLVNLNHLQQVDEFFWKTVKELQSGERRLVKITIQNKLLQLAVQAVEFKLLEEEYKLISVQNIQGELEEQEFIAWQKLIRILTHEIMNSIAPVVSLSDTMNSMLENTNGILEEEDTYRLKRSINVIRNRSEGLLNFTETYRNLTRIPPPKFHAVDLKPMLERLQILFEPDFQERNIQFQNLTAGQSLVIQADATLLEQVLINLVKNAMDAVTDRPEATVSVSAKRTLEGKTEILIMDNGSGIPEDMLDKIFVPFFTTKAHGSGIGLSLSRQIIRLHKGSIEIHSVENEGTRVAINL